MLIIRLYWCAPQLQAHCGVTLRFHSGQARPTHCSRGPRGCGQVATLHTGQAEQAETPLRRRVRSYVPGCSCVAPGWCRCQPARPGQASQVVSGQARPGQVALRWPGCAALCQAVPAVLCHAVPGQAVLLPCYVVLPGQAVLLLARSDHLEPTCSIVEPQSRPLLKPHIQFYLESH
jgi:hypothetical protein